MTVTWKRMCCVSKQARVAKCAILLILGVYLYLYFTNFWAETVTSYMIAALEEASPLDNGAERTLRSYQQLYVDDDENDLLLLEPSQTPPYEETQPEELPIFWKEHSEQDILKRKSRPMQNFSISDPYNHSDSNLNLVPLRVNLSELAKFRKQAFPEYHKEVARLQNASQDDVTTAEDLTMLELFPPLSAESRAQLIFTMDVFVRACRQYRWTYFLVGGTLLGAYRHHGLIPWDVDIDVVVNGSNWREVRHVLGNTPGFTLWTQRSGVWRFYLSHLPKVESPSKWPFVEIYFFSEDDEHLWGLTNSLKYLMVDRERVLPLSTSRWEHLNVSVPACTERMVKTEFDVSRCVSHYMVSETEGFDVREPEGNVDCSRLYSVYPFVFRNQSHDTDIVVESRRIGQSVVEEVTKSVEPKLCQN